MALQRQGTTSLWKGPGSRGPRTSPSTPDVPSPPSVTSPDQEVESRRVYHGYPHDRSLYNRRREGACQVTRCVTSPRNSTSDETVPPSDGSDLTTCRPYRSGSLEPDTEVGGLFRVHSVIRPAEGFEDTEGAEETLSLCLPESVFSRGRGVMDSGTDRVGKKTFTVENLLLVPRLSFTDEVTCLFFSQRSKLFFIFIIITELSQ